MNVELLFKQWSYHAGEAHPVFLVYGYRVGCEISSAHAEPLNLKSFLVKLKYLNLKVLCKELNIRINL